MANYLELCSNTHCWVLSSLCFKYYLVTINLILFLNLL